MAEFKDRLNQAMLLRDLTAAELSRLSGVNEGAISQYKAGKYKASQRSLDKLASILRVSIPWLMGADVPMEETAPDSSPKFPSNATPLDFSHLQRIPILGCIAAGMPIYAEQNIEGYTYTDLNGGAEYFALRVKGDSMDAAGIKDGYIVIVRRQNIVEEGEIAVVLVDHENATLKRVYRTDSTITLMPQSSNPEHKPQIYNLADTHIDILGKVVKVEFMV